MQTHRYRAGLFVDDCQNVSFGSLMPGAKICRNHATWLHPTIHWSFGGQQRMLIGLRGRTAFRCVELRCEFEANL